MGDRVVTVATLLKDSGYHTYKTGKWHLGKTKESLPAARGFERSIALMESGADNWEKKTYLPMYDFVHFYEGYEETDLPEDFFSTDYYTDRLIEYIGTDQGDGKPFFAYVSLQAQHYPLQAPQEYIDKYDGVYDADWDEIRAQRYARQVEMGLLPAGLTLPPIAAAQAWDALSDEERRMQTKVFPEWYAANFDLSYEGMGQPGSYVNYGPGWAGASAAPLTLFKGSASEGGMRMPLIVSYPAVMDAAITVWSVLYFVSLRGKTGS